MLSAARAAPARAHEGCRHQVAGAAPLAQPCHAPRPCVAALESSQSAACTCPCGSPGRAGRACMLCRPRSRGGAVLPTPCLPSSPLATPGCCASTASRGASTARLLCGLTESRVRRPACGSSSGACLRRMPWRRQRRCTPLLHTSAPRTPALLRAPHQLIPPSAEVRKEFSYQGRRVVSFGWVGDALVRSPHPRHPAPWWRYQRRRRMSCCLAAVPQFHTAGDCPLLRLPALAHAARAALPRRCAHASKKQKTHARQRWAAGHAYMPSLPLPTCTTPPNMRRHVAADAGARRRACG